MADITITPASVVQSTSAFAETGTFGETVTAGQAVYKKAADGKFWLAQCDDAAMDDCYGIALNGGSANQPATIQIRGNITIGGTVAVGTVYALSAVFGGICPIADIVSTNYVTLIGVGISTTVIQMALLTTGIAKA